MGACATGWYLLMMLGAVTAANAENVDIPLRVETSRSGLVKLSVPVTLNHFKENYPLDTGAEVTNVPATSRTESLKHSGSYTAKTIKSTNRCDVVLIPKISVGSENFEKTFATRCPSYAFANLGNNFFVKYRTITLDTREKKLRLSTKPMGGAHTYPLKTNNTDPRLETPIIQAKLGDQTFDAMLDTGTDTTTFDIKFVKAHPELFEDENRRVGVVSRVDAGVVTSEVYRLKQSISIGGYSFPKLTEVGAEALPFHFTMLIGTDLIMQADQWSWSFKDHLWSVQQHIEAEAGVTESPELVHQ